MGVKHDVPAQPFANVTYNIWCIRVLGYDLRPDSSVVQEFLNNASYFDCPPRWTCAWCGDKLAAQVNQGLTLRLDFHINRME